MNIETIRKLVQLNHQFYQSCAHSFSQTRQRVQPGVRRIIQTYITPQPGCRLLDVGCGNGDFLPALSEADFEGAYTGIDFSTALLSETHLPDTHFPVSFFEKDISAPGWTADLPAGGFDLICCFAVLHHIPSKDLRLDLLKSMAGLLAPGGKLVTSMWQFQRSIRLAKRIQPWAEIAIDESQLDTGDYLLDWRGSDQPCPALRYVHVYDEAEVHHLADAAGGRILESFTCDGREGNLADYYVWSFAD
jgi:tRNA (uracil-5-)-methyltransferase TRM9